MKRRRARLKILAADDYVSYGGWTLFEAIERIKFAELKRRTDGRMETEHDDPAEAKNKKYVSFRFHRINDHTTTMQCNAESQSLDVKDCLRRRHRF
jgi:hypothetical protein